MITPTYLALLTIFTGVPLLARFRWQIGALVRVAGMIMNYDIGFCRIDIKSQSGSASGYQ